MNHDSISLGLELLEKLDKKDKKENVCKECDNFDRFKEKCHFYWENKKFCSQHSSHNINLNF